ncbi:capping protein inhibiting regulator of actin dynamics [Trichosurus vulpecula]|uniref:capping protein inhibiting regulator of actin dynamics n=1 Tax=Trichosurus vulpecula TaxID=9337 RepID=UPI00186B54CA|nr:capping protein inhibiting regulator of actin dynamics [Trichosurus vulpecula]
MGTRAFSHDSIFIPDGGAESEQTVQAVSQDNILGKVKTPQPQLGKNIKFGQSPPPTALPMKRTDTPSPETSLEEDLFLSSPMEIVTHQDLVLSDSENKSSDTPTSLSPLNLPGTGSEMEEKVAPVKSSRPKRHFSSAGTIESVNLDAIPRAIARLDNSAAKHKLAVKPKNQRVSRNHRRLSKDRQNEQESFESQLSLDQNGHSGEEKQAWHEEEFKALDSEEEKRQQEEYWRHLEAEYRRQKAEKKRLEEQRLQEEERRLWEENQKPFLEEEEEEEEEKQQHLEGQRPPEKERQRPEEQNRQELEENRQKEANQELEEKKFLEVEEPPCWQQEAEKPLGELKRQEGLQEQRKREIEKQHQEEEAKLLEELRRREETDLWKRREAEKQRQEEEAKLLQELRSREETEEQKRREAERQRQEEEAKLLQELWSLEETEERKRREAEKQRQEEEEAKLLQELQSLEETEEQNRQEAEKQRQEEEEAKLLQELRSQEEIEEQRKSEGEKRRWEDEVKALEELKGQDLGIGEQSKQELAKQLQREEEQQQQWKEGKHSEAVQEQSILGLQGQPEAGEGRHLSKKNLEEQKCPKHEGHERNLRGLQLVEKQSPRVEGVRERQQTGENGHGGAPLLQEKREGMQQGHPQKEKRRPEDELAQVEKKETVTMKKDHVGEELRWQEVEERQTMPRPYTFQVSSGGKQILFPKVNLSPVTLGKESGLPSISQEPKASKSSKASHPLPSSLSIPHTAILVTGAQLCGPAVNLNQIKDTACKTLLGLSEEKKQIDIPALENMPKGTHDTRAASGKAKFPQESQSSKAALAEWESIRSRILKNTDNGQVNERDQLRHSGESTSKGRSDSRGNLRKTLSANAKFSIMPAWQKFSDGGIAGQKQNAEHLRNKAGLGSGEKAEVQPPAGGNNGHQKIPERTGMQQEPSDTAEGYKFAKDLPSFLVPSSPLAPQRALDQADLAASSESETSSMGKAGDIMPSGEESTSPFGIKLRRTNYSLRFHYDQQVEQSRKKKRHSTGDNFDGVASVLKNKDGEKETIIVKGTTSPTQEKKNDPLGLKDSLDSPGRHPAQPAPPLPSNHIPSLDHDKPGAKSPLPQKPALAPKPTSQTPPSSPLSKMGRPFLAELLSRRAAKPDQDASEKLNESKDSGDLQLPPVPHTEKRKEEEETAEKKSPSPFASISQQEKPDKTLEPGKKEKPVLQSWHSLEGSKSMEKTETAQPQWVTLALQKQKGFREQQATREERKQAREAKQTERVSKNNAGVSQQPESSNISRTGSLHKSTAQEDEKKIETAVSRLERREQLKKSNTLPTSVTVDISDSAMPASLVKEVPKRFSTPDAAPVSTEPAWLALAKRKAKAWSDCPQIIK